MTSLTLLDLDKLLAEAEKLPAKLCWNCLLTHSASQLQENPELVMWPLSSVSCPKHSIQLLRPEQITNRVLSLKGALIVREERPLVFLVRAYKALAQHRFKRFEGPPQG